MPRQNEDKINKMLSATLEVLSKKGYENTTINDIADTAKISRGLLHYYFKDKEDLAAKAMAFGFGSMWDASINSLSGARSAEGLVDSMIEVLKKNIKESPDFSALLFEMWVSSRRSAKIRKVFSDGLEEAVARLKALLGFAASVGVIKINSDDAEGLVRIVLAMYHGLAIQLLTNPDKLEDKKVWAPIRNVLLYAFSGKA
jgi:AcrR family transcriptional regulator